MWLNGDHLPDRDNAGKLASYLGAEIYDALGLPRPNPYLQKINKIFENLSSDHQRKLAKDAERYEANKLSKIPKQRKTSANK